MVQSQVGVGSKFTLRLPIRSPLSIDPSSTSGGMPMAPPTDED